MDRFDTLAFEFFLSEWIESPTLAQRKS
jgi:hypothetical protein